MKWYTIRHIAPVALAAAAAVAGAPSAAAKSAEVWIYGDIGESWWSEGVLAKDFVKEVAALDVDELTVRINSMGGSVPDGLAIYNALKRHRASVTVTIDAMAASIASLIAMAGDRVEIAENALMMIHAPWARVVGNAAELRVAADLLDKWAQSMATSYAAKTGKSVDDVLGWFADGQDHWLTAEECVAEGLADATTSAMPIAASASRFPWNRGGSSGGNPSAPPAHQRTPAATAATHQEPSMTDPTKPADVDVQAAAAKAVREENLRQADIRAAFAPYAALEGAAAELEACLKDTAVDVVKAKAKILDLKAKGIEPASTGYVAVTHDERDKVRAGMQAAMEIRAGLQKNDTTVPWRGYTLVELARACLSASGVRQVPGDKMGMIALAFTHSSSDFPLLLANVANKAMMKGYEEADETFQVWTTPGSLPDFKVQSTVDLGSFPSLRKVNPGAEYKVITVGERAESRVLATYGERFPITRQAIINDDLDAFSRIPRKMGRAAIRTVGDLVYAVLTGNPNMADGVALFHASHGNLQGAAGITTASVDAVRVAMARQKDTGQTTGSLNIRLKYLIVPVTLQGSANVARDSEFEVVSAAPKNHTVPNSVRGLFEVVSDARLDDASTSIWYGSADPTMHDTVIVDYLDGVQTPTLEQQMGWTIDGTEFKVRMDAAAKALDWKTMQRTG